jgi:hypothetical protein
MSYLTRLPMTRGQRPAPQTPRYSRGYRRSEIQLGAKLHAPRLISADDLTELPGQKIDVRLIQIDSIEEVEDFRPHLEADRTVEAHVLA